MQEESVGDAPVQEESVGDNPMVTVVDPAPIVANLDAPADDDPDDNYDDDDDDDDDDDTENDTGIMPKYIKAIQNRIRHENSSAGVEGWLMEYLRKHDWWIRAIDRRRLCHKLKLELAEDRRYHYPRATHREYFMTREKVLARRHDCGGSDERKDRRSTAAKDPPPPRPNPARRTHHRDCHP